MRYRVKVREVRYDGKNYIVGSEFDGRNDDRDLRILQKLGRIEEAPPEKPARRRKEPEPTEASGEYSRRDMQAQSITRRSADDVEGS